MHEPQEGEELAGYVIEFPMPPSLNNRMFCTQKRMVLSRSYREWKTKAVATLIETFDETKVAFLPGDARYRVTIWFSFRDKRRRDIDGFAKPILDAITEGCVAWDDDEQVDELMLYRHPPGKNAALVMVETLVDGNRE